jgi:DNA-binding HxlR family transcriptional regulator
MPMPSTYPDQNCSIARSLEVVGERWTLLIVRDLFYGVRRFGDFVTQLGIPRAILADRLRLLAEHGVVVRGRDGGGTAEYRLTAKGEQLWPVLRAYMAWGDAFYAPGGAPRKLRHDNDGGLLDEHGCCQACGAAVPLPDVRLEPGPGFVRDPAADNPVSAAINTPRRLLEPIAAAAAGR